MTPAEVEKLIDGWIALQKAQHGSETFESHFWAFEKVYSLVAAKPQEALAFILAVLEREQSPVVMENLSAGPLENLLSGHGEMLIGQIEDEAGRNPAFASLLGGVWESEMDGKVWKRVVACRNPSGWDGRA